MEIQVKIVNVLPVQTFTSSKTGNSYSKYTFVGETAGQYPKKIAFTVMGEDKFNGMGIVVDGTYTVSFDVNRANGRESGLPRLAHGNPYVLMARKVSTKHHKRIQAKRKPLQAP